MHAASMHAAHVAPMHGPCRCRQLLAITTFYVANTALSLGGLSKLNVPMYTTLKRLTPIFVLVTKVGPYSQV